jgi:hypothetical protein
MTDLELVKACAEAMGLPLLPAYDKGDIRYRHQSDDNGLMVATDAQHYFTERGSYDPLHDDAQAMALARRFMLEVDFFVNSASTPPSAERQSIHYCDENINRAICECVAKLRTPA